MTKSIVIDTNAYSAYKQGKKDAQEVITTAGTIVISSTMLGELLAGFLGGKREQANKQELQEFLEEPKVSFFTVNAQTAEEYAKIYQMLKQKGTPIPTNDMWIAAMAKQLGMAIFTFDAHFFHIKGLKVIQSSKDW